MTSPVQALPPHELQQFNQDDLRGASLAFKRLLEFAEVNRIKDGELPLVRALIRAQRKLSPGRDGTIGNLVNPFNQLNILGNLGAYVFRAGQRQTEAKKLYISFSALLWPWAYLSLPLYERKQQAEDFAIQALNRSLVLKVDPNDPDSRKRKWAPRLSTPFHL